MTAEEKSPHSEKKAAGIFCKHHGTTIGLLALVIYVIILAMGTIAEIFDIEAVFNWWIFRPPDQQ